MSTRTKSVGTAPTLSEQLRAVPLLRALVPMVVGIALGTLAHKIPFWSWAAATVICALAAGLSGREDTPWLLGKRTSATEPSLHTEDNPATEPSPRLQRLIPTLYIALAILFFGATLARLHTPEPVIPRGERVWLEVQITEEPTLRGKSARTSGIALRWAPEATKPDKTYNAAEEHKNLEKHGEHRAENHEWQSAGEKLLVSFDTIHRFEMGERIVFRGYVNPVSDSATSYSRLMTARGYTGHTYISKYSRPAVSPAESGSGLFGSLFSPAKAAKSLSLLARRLQSDATARLHRLDNRASKDHPYLTKTPDTPTPPNTQKNTRLSQAIATATAMTTGDRTAITPDLRTAYSRTGASHLLAVSGLHVGIVFLLVNILLYLLPLFPRGHIVKNILAVVAIWGYAALTGLSPSATRAAFMFSGAQLALASSRTRNATNIMCGTALVMLAVKPGLLFDISFQLSFIAVAAILAWFRPLYRLVESRFKLLNALWATLIVGLTASVATMPLVSYTFGVFSPAGIVLNPVVILTAHLIVVFSLLWIIAPLPLLEPVFRWLVGGPAWLQNRVIELVSTVPGAAIEWRMPLWLVFVIYALMIIFTAWGIGKTKNDKQPRNTV